MNFGDLIRQVVEVVQVGHELNVGTETRLQLNVRAT